MKRPFITSTPAVQRLFFVGVLNKTRANTRQERRRENGSRALLFCFRINCPDAGPLIPYSPLLDKLAQCDREVARGALKPVGRSLKLVGRVPRLLPRGDGRERVGDLRVQTFRGRLHFLLGPRHTLRRGGR